MTLIENINDIITCLTQAANKLRTLSGSSAKILPEDIATEIQNVYDSKTPNLQSKTYTPTDPNNDVVLTPDEGYDGFNEVTISPALLMSIQRAASQVEQIITAPSPYYGLSQVVIPPARLKNITVKSSIDGMSWGYPVPDGYYGYGEISVQGISLQDKTVTVTPNETETVTPDQGYDGLNSVTIHTNVQPVETKDYNFFDWDGTLVYSYTAAEINALTELPALPTHNNVVGKEWNYTLAQLKTLASLTTPYPANIGAIYSAPDGYSTIIKIKIPDDDTVRDFQISWTENTQSPVDIDWGDNQTETIAGASSVTANHTYSASGEYYITITPDSNSNVITIPTNGTFLGANARQKNYVKAVIVGRCYQTVSVGNTGGWFIDLHNLEICSYSYNNSTDLPRNTFNRATSLKALHVPSWINGVGVSHVVATGVSVITVPYNCTTIQYEAFTSNPALTYFTYPYTMTSLTQRTIAYSNIRKLILPPNITTIVTGAYQNKNVAITELVLPQSLTTIEASAFAITDGGTFGMYISYLSIPTGVTSIGSDAFRARVIGVMDLRGRQTMPTLGNSAAVNNVRVFVVDDDAYDAAIVATNWATYANKFVKASDYNA